MRCAWRGRCALPRGTILIFDRGYTDYQWFTSLTQQGLYFATRLKENADYGVVEKREILPGRDVLRDEVVFFYKLEQESQEAFYRRIEFYVRLALSSLVALLRQQLFVYRDLRAWIDDPFQPPPIPGSSREQLTLQLA